AVEAGLNGIAVVGGNGALVHVDGGHVGVADDIGAQTDAFQLHGAVIVGIHLVQGIAQICSVVGGVGGNLDTELPVNSVKVIVGAVIPQNRNGVITVPVLIGEVKSIDGVNNNSILGAV